MFARFFQWLYNRRAEQSRQIFRYWDGKRTRRADPMAVIVSLREDPEYLSERHDQLIDAGDKEAQLIAIRAVQRVFGIEPFEQGGLTYTECLSLLMSFYLYLDALKKNIDQLLTSQQPTASQPLEASTTSAA
jgi:hypothetical protein